MARIWALGDNIDTDQILPGAWYLRGVVFLNS